MTGRRTPRPAAAPRYLWAARSRRHLAHEPHRGRTIRRIVILGAGVVLASSVVGAAPGTALHTAGLVAAGPVGSAMTRFATVAGDTAAGTTSLGAPLAVVALGDSIPKGFDCPDCTPFPDLLGESLHAPDSAAAPITNLGFPTRCVR